MNLLQRIIISLGLFVIVAFCLRPPYQWENTTYLMTRETPYKVSVAIKQINHRWIWSPSEGSIQEGFTSTPETYQILESSITQVDWPRLGICVGLTLAVTLFGAFVAFGNRKPVK